MLLNARDATLEAASDLQASRLRPPLAVTLFIRIKPSVDLLGQLIELVECGEQFE